VTSTSPCCNCSRAAAERMIRADPCPIPSPTLRPSFAHSMSVGVGVRWARHREGVATGRPVRVGRPWPGRNISDTRGIVRDKWQHFWNPPLDAPKRYRASLSQTWEWMEAPFDEVRRILERLPPQL
jgi:hypothetical protein